MNHNSPNASSPESLSESTFHKQVPTRRRWTILSLACGVSWLMYLHRYSFNLVRPYLEEEYNFTNLQLDSIYVLFNVSYTLGQVPSGIVCDLFGPHFFLVGIIILWSLTLPTIGLTGNLYGLGATRLLFGATQAGGYPSLSKISRTWLPSKTRTLGQALIATLSGRGGGAMSQILLATVLMGYFGLTWRWSLVAMSLLGIGFAILFLLLFRNLPEKDPGVNLAELQLIRAEEPSPSRDQPENASPAVEPHAETDESQQMGTLNFARALQNPSMLVFMIQQMFNAGADYIYVALTGSFFLARYDVELTDLGILASLPLFGGALGGLFAGGLTDWLIKYTGNRRKVRSAIGFTGKFVAAILLVLVIFQESAYEAGLLLFGVKFFSDWSQPTVWGTCTDMGGRCSASVFSMINTAGGIGGFIMPIAGAKLLDYCTVMVDGVRVTSFGPLFAVVAGAYVLSALSWFFIDCTQRLDLKETSSALNR